MQEPESSLLIADLIAKSLREELSEEEKVMLEAWVDAHADNAKVWAAIKEEASRREGMKLFAQFDEEAALKRFLADREVSTRIATVKPANRVPTVHRVHLLRTAWFRVAVAVILVISVAAYWLMDGHDSTKGPVLTEHKKTNATEDVMPGTNRATLVLGDESVIALDTAANGILSRQGESEVIKTENGEIVYVGGRKAINSSGEIYYQKLITPRGGTYQVTLADGTQAWLNAESSIRFPNIFNGNERTVEITGEVYFDVKADKSKPFIVKTNSDQITVMGTRFNVHAYANEKGVKTSLVEGAVKVGEQVLRPGQAYQNGKIKTTNINSDVAWMKGMFAFADTDVESIMRQVSRWYDVEIVYEGKIPDAELTGEISRSLSLSKLLNGLSVYGIEYRIENRKVFISEK